VFTKLTSVTQKCGFYTGSADQCEQKCQLFLVS